MNSNLFPGLRSEDEFQREYKALTQLITNLEERSELINLDKRKDPEQKKIDLFDANRSISNQIQETNKELDKKLKSNLALVENLDQNLENLKKTNQKIISDFKHVVSDIATKKAEDLIDLKTKEQISMAKNLFFKKVLREIVVGNDKEEEAIKMLENQLLMKEKLLKKSLLAAEHFRIEIEKVEARAKSMMKTTSEFMKKISHAIGFGHAKVSEEMTNIQARKVLETESRNDKNIRKHIKMKDRMVLVEADRICIYDSISKSPPSLVYPFSEIKEIHLRKDEEEHHHVMDGLDFGDPSRLGTVFYVKFKNERGGIIIEPDGDNVPKWDFIFFIVNLIISQLSLVNSNLMNYKPLTLESNLGKLNKNFNVKTFDTISIKKHMPFEYEFSVEESTQGEEIEDRLIDWQILERTATMHSSLLSKRMGDKLKKDRGEEGNHKATLTEVAGGLNANIETNKIYEHLEMIVEQTTREARAKTQEFNYTLPNLSSYIDSVHGLDNVNGGNKSNNPDIKKIVEKDMEDKPPSPMVELDVSYESKEPEEPEQHEVVPENDRANEKNPQAGAQNNQEARPANAMRGNLLDRNRNLSPASPLVARLGQTLFTEKNELSTYIGEKVYKQNVLRHLLKGIISKASGLKSNPGSFLIKMNNDFTLIEKINLDGQNLKKISFSFTITNQKGERLKGHSLINLIFKDDAEWEFLLQKRTKHTFYTNLIDYRENISDYKDIIITK